jgi:hypothetical protein
MGIASALFDGTIALATKFSNSNTNFGIMATIPLCGRTNWQDHWLNLSSITSAKSNEPTNKAMDAKCSIGRLDLR